MKSNKKINTVKLLDVVSIGGKSVKEFDNELMYLSTGDLEESNIVNLEPVTFDSRPSRANQLVEINDILFAKMKDTRKTLLINENTKNIIVSTGFYVLRASNKVLPKYIYHYLNSDYFLNQKNKLCKGATQKAINNDGLKQIDIVLYDDKIQDKIVELLDKSKELIDKRKEQIKSLDELVKSKFIEMFGDPAFNPKEWNIKSFDEVFNISSSSRILKSEWKTEGTIPFYRVRDMVFLSENGVANNEFFVSEEFYESLQNEKGIPQYGDIMVSATSTIGKCYIVKPGEKFYYKDADILRFRKKVELAPEYFIHFMKTSFAVNQIERTFGITTVPHFTIVNSKKINMIYPPIELQNQFADFVKQVDKLKFEMEKSLKELEDNFNSLMQKAFKGELFG